MTRLLAVCALVLTVCASAVAMAAPPSGIPRALAFNNGIYSKAAIDAAVAAGRAAIKPGEPTADTVVQHLIIEVFENDPGAAIQQAVAFALVETRFRAPINVGAPILVAATARYVWLDAFGKPVAANSSVLSATGGPNNTWAWKSEAGPPSASFVKALPEWARKRLWLTAGFLAKNPGQPPVAYTLTKEQKMVRLLSAIAGFAPGLAKGAVQGIVENVAKALVLEAAGAAAAPNKRWGTSDDLVDSRFTSHGAQYEVAGKAYWPLG